MYPEKFIRDNVVAPFLLLSVVIETKRYYAGRARPYGVGGTTGSAPGNYLPRPQGVFTPTPSPAGSVKSSYT